MRRPRRVLAVALVTALLAVVVGPLLAWLPPLPDTLPPEALADEDSRFVSVDGLRVHYKAAGDGARDAPIEPPRTAFLLLHGFLASTYSWRDVMAPLASWGRVLAYDRPGFGLTERPTRGSWDSGQDNPYAPEAQVELAVGILEALGSDDAVLVGHSAGGAVATAAALEHPERVRALVLLAPALQQEHGAAPWARPLLDTPQGRRLGTWFVRTVPRWGMALARESWHDPSRLTDEVLAGYRKPLQAQGWDAALWELVLAGTDYGLADRLAAVSVPTLVITGDDDRVVPPERSRAVAEAIPGAQLVVIDGCGHVVHEECPEATVDAIEAFLARLPASDERTEPARAPNLAGVACAPPRASAPTP